MKKIWIRRKMNWLAKGGKNSHLSIIILLILSTICTLIPPNFPWIPKGEKSFLKISIPSVFINYSIFIVYFLILKKGRHIFFNHFFS